MAFFKHSHQFWIIFVSPIFDEKYPPIFLRYFRYIRKIQVPIYPCLPIFQSLTTTKDKRALRHLAARFVICGETLYRRLTDGMVLLCLNCASTDRMMRKVHAGVYRPHMGGHMLAHKIMRTSYFWLTMETDCCQFVQRCPECQTHGDLIHVPSSELHALTSP